MAVDLSLEEPLAVRIELEPPERYAERRDEVGIAEAAVDEVDGGPGVLDRLRDAAGLGERHRRGLVPDELKPRIRPRPGEGGFRVNDGALWVRDHQATRRGEPVGPDGV